MVANGFPAGEGMDAKKYSHEVNGWHWLVVGYVTWCPPFETWRRPNTLVVTLSMARLPGGRIQVPEPFFEPHDAVARLCYRRRASCVMISGSSTS